MKKLLILMLSSVFVIGCGNSDQARNSSEKKFQGIRAEKGYVKEGMKYLADSDIPNAIRSFDKAIKDDPTDVNNYIVLGQVYLRLKQYGRAADTLQGATRIAPNNGELYYLVAMARGLQGEKEIAVKAAQRSVEIFLQNKNEDSFKQSVALLKGLTDSDTNKTIAQNSEEKPAAVTTAMKKMGTEVQDLVEDAGDKITETAASTKKTVEEDVQNIP